MHDPSRSFPVFQHGTGGEQCFYFPASTLCEVRFISRIKHPLKSTGGRGKTRRSQKRLKSGAVYFELCVYPAVYILMI